MFRKLARAISVRLSSLKCRRGANPLRRLSMKCHAWSVRTRDALKEAFLVCKYSITIQWIKLRMALAPHRIPGTIRGLRKSGLLASMVLLSLILFMGHTATVAWLTYTTPTTRNTFQVGRMELQVSYRNDKMTEFLPMTEYSSVFNDEALYEPGFTQVVYFKVKNTGTIPFDYRISARDFISEKGVNIFGRTFDLADYLYFGMVTAPSLPELESRLATREAAEAVAQELASQKLGTYAKDGSRLTMNQEEYAAIIIYMPWFVGNEANYNNNPPQITMGITVTAQQPRN